MLAQTTRLKKFSPDYNQALINNSAKSPKTAKDFTAYTGLPRKQARRWHQDPQQYINQLLEEALARVATVPNPVCTAPVSTADKLKAVSGAGSLGFTVSFMLAKFWTSLWGLLASLRIGDPRLFFIVGAAGFDVIASVLHATVAKAVAFGPGANYGGPQAPDKTAFENYNTLLCMWYVAKAEGKTERADEIAAALQEVIDGLLARVQAEEAKGTPLSFDFRGHPVLGAWLRNQHFHWAFFSYSFWYLASGSIAPNSRVWIETLPATVAQKSGLFALVDFVLSAGLGQLSGMSTLGIHMLGNAKVQHGAEKPGLHQTWRQEQPTVLAKGLALTPELVALIEIRSGIEKSIQSSTLSPEEKHQRLATFEAEVLPLLNPPIDRLQTMLGKFQQRSALLETKAGRDKIARKKTAAVVFEGAGKTPHKIINQSPGAIRVRTASEVIGNMFSLIPLAYALFHLSTLFATTLPFTDTSASAHFGSSPNTTDLWNTTDASFTNGAHALPGVPLDTQLFSTWIGWILIASFTTRAGLIPGTEQLLSLLWAAFAWLGRQTDPARRQGAGPSLETVETVETDEDDELDEDLDPPPPSYVPDPPENAAELKFVRIDSEFERKVERRSTLDPDTPYPLSSVTVISDVLNSPDRRSSSSSEQLGDNDIGSDDSSDAQEGGSGGDHEADWPEDGTEFEQDAPRLSTAVMVQDLFDQQQTTMKTANE